MEGLVARPLTHRSIRYSCLFLICQAPVCAFAARALHVPGLEAAYREGGGGGRGGMGDQVGKLGMAGWFGDGKNHGMAVGESWLAVGSAHSIVEANIGTMGSSPGVVSNVAEPVGVLSAIFRPAISGGALNFPRWCAFPVVPFSQQP